MEESACGAVSVHCRTSSHWAFIFPTSIDKKQKNYQDDGRNCVNLHSAVTKQKLRLCFRPFLSRSCLG